MLAKEGPPTDAQRVPPVPKGSKRRREAVESGTLRLERVTDPEKDLPEVAGQGARELPKCHVTATIAERHTSVTSVESDVVTTRHSAVTAGG